MVQLTDALLVFAGILVINAILSGLDALQHLEGNAAPSLVLVDLMMPRLDGEGFVAALRGIPELSQVPVAILSGHRSAKNKAEELFAVACLTKPIELTDLLDVVGRFASPR